LSKWASYWQEQIVCPVIGSVNTGRPDSQHEVVPGGGGPLPPPTTVPPVIDAGVAAPTPGELDVVAGVMPIAWPADVAEALGIKTCVAEAVVVDVFELVDEFSGEFDFDDDADAEPQLLI